MSTGIKDNDTHRIPPGLELFRNDHSARLSTAQTSQWRYALQVWVTGGRRSRYVFDQPLLRVGRGHRADLRIEHACVAREQLCIERMPSSLGEVLFRIVPVASATNPTYLNGSAVEQPGELGPGDIIAVGEVRLMLEQVDSSDTPSRRSALWSTLGLVLILITMIAAALVVYWRLAQHVGGAGTPVAAQTR